MYILNNAGRSALSPEKMKMTAKKKSVKKSAKKTVKKFDWRTSPLFGPAVGGKRGKVLSREALSRIEKDKVEFAALLKRMRNATT